MIYKKDPESAQLFVWTSVLAQTHGVRNAGVGGKVTIDGTKMILEGVKLTIIEVGKTAFTEKKTGKYEMTPLSSGKYTMLIEMEGYEPQTIKFKVNTGSITRLNVAMKLIAAVM